MHEIWCDYCNAFRELNSDGFDLRCKECGCTVARLNFSGLYYCEDCRVYRKAEQEEPHPPLPEDSLNQGYLVGDVVCSHCCGILLVIRVPANCPAMKG
jgi:hypothetical protein